MKRFALFTPFLFALASLLQLYYVAAVAVSPSQILRPLLVLWALLLCLLLPIQWLLRDWTWTAVFLVVFVLGFYYSSDFFSTISILILILSLVWLVFGRVAKIKVEISHFLNLLTGVGLFFVFYALFVIGAMLLKIPWSVYADSVASVKLNSQYNLSNPVVKRDIYYIILDGYARSDVLQELFGFDNSEFVNELKELGFIVPENFHSNYPMTHLSVTSTLNMEYLDELTPGLEQTYNRWLMKPFIDHSRVRTLLEGEGYKTISISSDWTITENATTDKYIHPYPVMLNDFERFVLGSTPMRVAGPLLQGFVSVGSAETHRKVVLFSLETLSSMPEVSGSKFVFAHIISPHPPFIFDKDGNPVAIPYTFNFKDGNEYPGAGEGYGWGYINQLQFINRRLKDTLSTIIANSENPPVIIIMADHGSGLLTDFSSAKNTCAWERFSPFAAYYLPEVDGQSIPSDGSAVNAFRIIFNEYFDAGFPLLESRQYFYRHPVSFYEFEDVTERVDDRCY